MKKLLLPFLLFLGLTVVSSVLLGQPTYTPATNYPLTTTMSLAPVPTATVALGYSTTGTTILAAANGLSGAYGMAVDPTGNVYVVNFTGNTVTEYSTTGVVSSFGTSTNLSGPVGIVFDASGNAYVLNKTGNNVVKYTGGVYQSTIITGLSAPTGIAIDASNNIYVGNSTTRTISRYTTAGGTASFSFTTPDNTYPVSAGIAVDPTGKIYVTDNYGTGSYMDIYAATGGTPTEYSIGSTNTGVYIDASGEVFLSTTGNGRATAYTAAFATVTQAETGFNSPRGIITDQKGNLYVSDFSTNKVTKYASTGGYYLGGTIPPGLTFSATTGTFGGAPTVAYTGTYTVTKINASVVTTSNTFTIHCGQPTISYTGSPYNYSVSTPITTVTPTVTGSPTITISPNITTNTGLAFSASTGAISGTPTTASGPVTYTITATNAGGSVSTMISVQVYVASPTIAYTGSPFTYPVGVAITTLSPSTNTGSPTSYAISPNLNTNTGLTFNTTNGQISGTPTIASAATTYTISAYNANPTPGTTTISIATVNPPTASYAGSPYSFSVGTGITTIVPTTTNSPTSYTISPSLNTNTGLTFSTSNGQISGTPTAVSPATTYTITPSNAAGAGTPTTISVQVYPASPTIAYTGSPFTYGVGVSITTLAPSTNTGSPTSYTISPSLATNTGLTFSTTNGQISGTPTIASAAVTYTISAYNANPTPGTTMISIAVVSPPTVTYTGSPYTYTVGTSNGTVTPTSTNSPTSYAISPNLTTNTGLVFSTSTGAISGAPTAAYPATNYTVTPTNQAGAGTPATISIVVYPAKPTISYTGSPFTYTVGTPITTLTPATTNSPTTFTISPSLATNTGLTFSTTNGQISGTPTTVSAATTYTITASNANPTAGSTTISVTVNQVAPVISYTTPDTYTVGATVSLPVTNNHSAVTTGYAITTGTLPSGLSLNPTTGLISGTANATTAALTVTITASTGSSSGTTTVSITVDDVAPTSITYSPSTNVYTVGTAITPLTPTVIGNIPAQIVFPAPSPAFSGPWGMGLDPTNNLWVANTNGYVNEFTASGTYVTSRNAVGNLTGIVFDAAGNAYVSRKGGAVVKFSSTGVSQGTILTAGAAYALAIDVSANIYVADEGNGVILKYTASTGTSATIVPTGSTITAPTGVAVDAAGNIYVLDNYYGTVSKYSSAGAFVSTLISGLNDPYGFSMDVAGNFYVGDSGDDNLRIYTSTGALINTISGLTDPRGVLVDTQGNIYVSDNTNNTVTKYPPRGGYILTGGALPPGLVFNPVNGTFSGTPSAAFAAVTYTVTVYNSGGSKSTTVTLSSVVKAPTLVYTPAPTPPATGYSFPVNAAITPLTPATNTGGPIAPVFGAGVAFTGGTLTNPYGMAFDATGNVYVANYNTPNSNTALTNVLEYSAAGAYQKVFITYASLQSKANPTAIGFDGSGNAYASIFAGYLYKYTSAGAYSSRVTLAPNEMDGLWVESSGNILLADLYDQAVYRYTPTGTNSLTISAANSAYISGPVNVSTDAAGNIYVLDNTNKDVVEFNSSGTYISTPVTGLSNPYGLYVGSTGYIYVADPGTGTNTGKVSIYSSTGALLSSLTGLSNPRGVIADANGNVYVSDFTANTITKYPTYNYVLTGGSLPTGLSFSNVTGVISGTPTVTPFGPVTYTVTAHGYGGTTATANLTISVYTSYDWIGATADWQTTTNWESKTIPTSSSAVNIGVNYPFTTSPVVSSTGSANAASVTFGNKGGTAGAAKLAGITVNTGYSLTVAGAITKQSDVNSAAAYISTLSGAGTVTAASLSVLPNLTATAAYADGITSTLTGTSPAAGLAITGNVSLTSASSPQPATLSFNVTGGVTSVAGTLSTNNASGSTSAFAVSNGTLQLANSAALSALSSTGTNTLSFVNTGATIEYSGAAQTVYTDAAITGLTTGPSYQNIKFSGTGVKTPNGTATSNLNVAGDFTNTLANTTASNVVLTGTIVNFNGSVVQNLAGGAGPTIATSALTTSAPSPTGTVFGNVTFNNPAAANNTKNIVSGGFSVAYNGVLTMLGSQSYTSLTITAPGSLTLNSTANGSATVAAYTGPIINGNVRVQRYITGGGATYRGYRLLSAPVAGSSGNANKTDLSYIKYTSYLKGYNGTAGGWDAAGNPNLFLYRENLPPSNATFSSGNYRSITTLYTSTTQITVTW